ncbi:hypothetical protein ACFP56_03865 [Paenibacillus septentrionalis]|uniref:Uncharacterized protein n=1 Tax=Paenibacillus septentrionalis TaxID=429342 RepID=A0ABW1UZ52_9BACL
MKIMLKVGFIAAIILMITLTTTETAEAGFFDRAKDIYNIPDKIEEIQMEYNAAKQAMENQIATQQEQLEQSRKQAEELMNRQDALNESNEYYRQQNEQYREKTEMLLAENQNLLLKMEQMEQARKSLYHKLLIAAGSIIALVFLYALSVRIWRFAVWRRQVRTREVQLP